MNQLDALKQVTTVVADTGNFAQLTQFQPQDATTNPSLILKAVQEPAYHHLLQEIVRTYGEHNNAELMEQLVVRFGCEILSLIKGRVSTEVDARYSFDSNFTVASARSIIALYEKKGYTKDRVLIKIAATWEGITAAQILEQEGIHTNLTLLFSFTQAIACAQAGVKLISPFVGRIYDWYKNQAGVNWNESECSGSNDPGVQSVTRIYNYYKKFDIDTEIMGASFRNLSQIKALTGCDFLTISPQLLAELQASTEPLPRQLKVIDAKAQDIHPMVLDEKAFRWAMNEDAMASEKLAEGIRTFVQDALKLEKLMNDERKK